MASSTEGFYTVCSV